MMYVINEPYHLFAEPLRYYNAMVDDMLAAKRSILLETYRIGNDVIGIRFLDALVQKAGEGLEVKLLVDYWGGGSVSHAFFAELVKAGGEVRFFEKIKINLDLFTKSHRRNHRKLLLIDDEITYIGSSNITDYNLNWRESVLRLRGSITRVFKKVFRQDFKLFDSFGIANKTNYLRVLKCGGFEVLRDVPSISKQRIKKRYVQLIKQAQTDIRIITPYFLPGYMLRKSLMDAARRGVKVQIIVPRHSDVSLVDILRNKYLGPLVEAGIDLLLYHPHNLHAKLMLVDREIFCMGSSNFDYRSFRYMYEIVLLGSQDDILRQVATFIDQTIDHTEAFDIAKWKRRPVINKVFEWLLLPVRHLL